MCRFSGCRFLLFFSRTGYQKKANFLEQVLKHVKRGNFITTDHYFVFLSILFTDFFRTGYHLKAKFLEQGEKILFRGHIPVQI